MRTAIEMPSAGQTDKVQPAAKEQKKIDEILDKLGEEVVLHIGKKLVGMLPRPQTEDLLEGRRQMVARAEALEELARPILLSEVKRMAKQAMANGHDAKEILDLTAACIAKESDIDYKTVEYKDGFRRNKEGLN